MRVWPARPSPLLLTVGALTAVAMGCRPRTPPLEEVAFTCRTDVDCRAGLSCRAGACLAPDAPLPELDAGLAKAPAVLSLDVTNGATGDNAGSHQFARGDPLRIAYRVEAENPLHRRALSFQYTVDNRVWRSGSSGDDVTVAGPPWFEVATSDGGRVAEGTFAELTAPTDGYFRLRVVARDATGRLSVPLLSPLLNAGRWSLYAGGQAAVRVAADPHSVRMTAGGYSTGVFTVNPTNGDVYAYDFGAAGVSSDVNLVYRLEAATQQVSVAFRLENTMLAEGPLAPLPSLSPLGLNTQQLAFDSHGLLYALSAMSSTEFGLFQIDLQARRARRYLGGGSDLSNTPTPTTASMFAGSFAFDGVDTLYYFVRCPGYANAFTDSVRLMKATQVEVNGVRSAGDISFVAGTCSRGPPDAGALATESPLLQPNAGAYPINVVPIDERLTYVNGKLASGPLRILDGRVYPTRLGAYASIAYSRLLNRVYVNQYSPTSALVRFAPSYEAEANAEELEVVAAPQNEGDCTADGRSTLADAGVDAGACLFSIAHLGVSATGEVWLADGTAINSVGPYRVRRIDEHGIVHTVLGSPRLAGAGGHRLLARSAFSGIAVKHEGDENTEAFPPGVYFVDVEASVLARIEPDTHPTRAGQVTVVAGNMSVAPVSMLSFSPQATLGAVGRGFAIDRSGLPSFSSNGNLMTADGGTAMSVRGFYVGANPWPTAMSLRGINLGTVLDSNLTQSRVGLFAAGTTCSILSGAACAEVPRIIHFPFDGTAPQPIIGGSSRAYSADVATPGNLQALTLSGGAGYGYAVSGGIVTQPFMLHDAATSPDRLYFVEGTELRYLTNPRSGSGDSTLVTLISHPKGIGNFTFNPAGGPYPLRSMIFFLSGETTSSRLFCMANPERPGAPSWCPASGADLGPGGFTTNVALAPNGPSVFGWLSPTQLLVRGVQAILLFDAS